MAQDNFSLPRDQRYFEDYKVGAVHRYGSIKITEADIVDFAKKFDPQPMHLDPRAAKNTPFGELIASGWHTAAVLSRLFVENYLSSVASVASPGIDDLRWKAPVRPGDTLYARITVVDARRSASKPDRGMVKSAIDVINQHNETVMSMKVMNLFMCRNPAPR